ncbi:MAG: hypothetical protein R6U57_02040 [Anaerolineales bacterium]
MNLDNTTGESPEEQDLEAENLPEEEMETPESVVEEEQEGIAEVEGAEVEEPVSEPEEGEKEVSRIGRFFRKVLIWLVVIAIAFGAGIATFYYLRFQPLQDKLGQRTQALSEAEDEVADLESEVERLSALEERNQELVIEIEQTQLHITILSARSSVSNALLALSEDNLAEAKLELDKVGRTFEKLESMLNEDQVEVVINMQQRHELIMEELEADRFSARSDLEVLSSKLGALENTLFASP